MVENIAIYSKSTIVLGIKGSDPLIPQPDKTIIMTLKNDLAMLYFPDIDADSARRQLLRYLKEYQYLRQELIMNGYSFAPKAHILPQKMWKSSKSTWANPLNACNLVQSCTFAGKYGHIWDNL